MFAGRGAFDLASLIASSLEPAARRRCERDLLATYHRLLVEGGVRGYPFERLWEDYCLSMLDGLFRMVLSIGPGTMREEQDRAHREVIWPRFAAALLDLEIGELLT